jgi:hypothetical protein
VVPPLVDVIRKRRTPKEAAVPQHSEPEHSDKTGD